MHLSMLVPELAAYTSAQLATFFPDGRHRRASELRPFVSLALDRLEHCFARINRPGYNVDDEPAFDHLHGDQYCTFLYYLSNTIHREGGDEALCKKLYLLNRAMHGFGCLYDVDLPDVFCVVHGAGTVLGRARYRDYLAVCHNTTIGAIGGVFPTMGERLILSAGASLIGDCLVGDNVLLEPGCSLVKTSVPANTRVGGPGPYTFKPNTPRPAEYYFRLHEASSAEESRAFAGAQESR
jgi:serine O-acetyltransferase